MQKPIIEDKIHIEVDSEAALIKFYMTVSNKRLVWDTDKLVVQIYLNESIVLPKPITHSLLDEISYTETSGSSGGVQSSINFLIGQVGAGSEISKGFEVSHPAIEWTSYKNSETNKDYYRFAVSKDAIKVVGNDHVLILLHWSQLANSHKIKEMRVVIGQEGKNGFVKLCQQKWKKPTQREIKTTSKSNATKVFISYARKDARKLALRLQADLQKDGLEVWLDTSEIEGGASWSTEIENAIETCTTALALLSAGSFVSEICRAEQLRCLRKGKQVIPILVQADAERPLHLEHINYRDFTSSADYKNSYVQILTDIRDTKAVASSGKIKETYTNAPALPLNFVERPEERDKLRQELIADDRERRIAITALQGMGGIGKSALAAWICRDEVVQAAFPDGVIWVDVGRENVNLLEKIALVGTKLGDTMGHYSNETAALSRLRETLPSKSALIVLDDV